MIRALFLLSILLLGSCSAKTIQDGAADRFYLFYNNDQFGFLEPCGCRISPIGGMDRRWNAMVDVSTERRIFVDAGNLFYKSANAAEYLAPQWFEQAVGVVEAYNLLKADAVTVGENDFALGVKKFLELKSKANFEFISSNIYHAGTNDLFLKDSMIVERQGKKVGIFAIFHPSLKLPMELEARDPIATAKAMVQKLRAKNVDLVVLLSHQGFDYDMDMANKIEGIDLIVGASSQSLLQTPRTVGKTTVVQLSSQGQMLGRLEYQLSKGTSPQESIVAEFNDEYKNNPTKEANPMKSLVAVTNLRMQEANRKLDEALWEKHDQEKLGSYQTFLSCRDCHTKQAQFQEGTLHAASYLTLMAKKQERNLDCVKCHSVGLGAPGGFKTIAGAFLDESGKSVPLKNIKEHMGWSEGELAAKAYRDNPTQIRPDVARWIVSLKKAGVKKAFVGTQCENCHVGMADHPFGDSKPTAVATNLCLQCHTKEQMPSWYNADGSLNKDAHKKDLVRVTCPR